MNKVVVQAPAKINFYLKVGKLLPSGLHEIKSALHTIALFDEVVIEKSPTAGGKQKIRLLVEGAYRLGVPANRDNTVYRAAEEFFRETRVRESVKITLRKNIPSRSGLGSASSDAAAVLRGLEKLFAIKLKNPLKIAHAIGSDVPFFLLGAPHAEIGGTGEEVKKLPPQEFFCLVAMLPRIFIGTAWAYSHLSPCEKFGDKNGNDFEDLVFKHFPDLQALKEEMMIRGATTAGLSGSGAAVYGIFTNSETATECARTLGEKCAFLWCGKEQ